MIAFTFLSVLVLPFVAVFWEAFVVAKLWGWFAASVFGGAQLSMLQAYGLIIMINVLKGSRPPEPAKTDTATPEARKAAVRTACGKLFGASWHRFVADASALGVAWFVHHWMR
jgi:hypothetical protein